MCNVSRGLLTLASSAIWLQANIAHNAQDDLRNITHDHKGILRTLGIWLRQFEDCEEILIGLSEDAAIPVALPEPFLNAISDECVTSSIVLTNIYMYLDTSLPCGSTHPACSSRPRSLRAADFLVAVIPLLAAGPLPRSLLRVSPPLACHAPTSLPRPLLIIRFPLLPPIASCLAPTASASHNVPASHTITTTSQNASGSETEPETDAEVADTTSTAFKATRRVASPELYTAPWPLRSSKNASTGRAEWRA